MVVLDHTEAVFIVCRERLLSGWCSKNRSAVFLGHPPQPAIICADDPVYASPVLENHVAAWPHLARRKIHIGSLRSALNPVRPALPPVIKGRSEVAEAL